MNKYNNSKIYKITSNIEPYFYIGSTILDIRRRLTFHINILIIKKISILYLLNGM